MSQLPFISVIIPTYNSNMIFLEQAICSVLGQTYPHFELIIVDDHSNKETQKNLLALKQKYAFRLFVLEQNSGGPSKPLNRGLTESKGNYIALCAHDDYWLPDKLKKQVDFLGKYPQFKVCYGRALQQKKIKFPKKPSVLKAVLFLMRCYCKNFVFLA